MKVYVQTPVGWKWITVPDVILPKTDIQRIRDDIATIKTKLGVV